MSHSIYGEFAQGAPTSAAPATAADQLRLNTYMLRASNILAGLIADRNKELALQRLDLIRQEIAVQQGTLFSPVKVKTSATTTLKPVQHPNGKLTLSNA